MFREGEGRGSDCKMAISCVSESLLSAIYSCDHFALWFVVDGSENWRGQALPVLGISATKSRTPS